MKEKTYLVTGAAGFIGSALASRLLEEGAHIISIDNLSTGYIDAVPKGVEFIKGDCADPKVIGQLETRNIDAIYHIAGQSSGEISFEDPVYDLQTNAQATLLLLQLARKINCSKFIFASTMSVYGTQPDKPVNEGATCIPQSFYAVGKLASEQYLRIYSQFGIDTTSLRLFNVYGPGQNMRNLKQGIVSIFLEQALTGKYIHVKGSPDRYRDLVYIDDIVNSFILTGNSSAKGYACYNVCTEIKTTIKELIDCICSELPYKVKVEYKGNTPGDQFGIYGDAQLIRSALNWQGKIGLKAGLTRMVQWAMAKEKDD
jgi:UDP-glucose 4-epimerase